MLFKRYGLFILPSKAQAGLELLRHWFGIGHFQERGGILKLPLINFFKHLCCCLNTVINRSEVSTIVIARINVQLFSTKRFLSFNRILFHHFLDSDFLTHKGFFVNFRLFFVDFRVLLLLLELLQETTAFRPLLN